MDTQTIILAVNGALLILFQFLAAYFGYKIYKFNRISKGWLALVWAFLIEGIRRVIPLLSGIKIMQPLIGLLSRLDRIIMFLITFFIIVGLYQMMKSFESFDVVEKKAKEKLKSFGKKKR